MQRIARNTIMLPALLACAVLAGCIPRATKPDVVVVPVARPGQILQVLDDVDNVLKLAPAAQAAEQQRLAQQFKRTQFPADRMRLALLDALLPGPAHKPAESSKLLAGYNWEAVGPGFKSLAALMLGVLNTRQMHAKNAQLLMQQLAVERAQKDRLQQQLDALKSIEKTMNQRDKSIATPPVTTLPPAATTKAPASAAPPGER